MPQSRGLVNKWLGAAAAVAVAAAVVMHAVAAVAAAEAAPGVCPGEVATTAKP